MTGTFWQFEYRRPGQEHWNVWERYSADRTEEMERHWIENGEDFKGVGYEIRLVRYDVTVVREKKL